MCVQLAPGVPPSASRAQGTALRALRRFGPPLSARSPACPSQAIGVHIPARSAACAVQSCSVAIRVPAIGQAGRLKLSARASRFRPPPAPHWPPAPTEQRPARLERPHHPHPPSAVRHRPSSPSAPTSASPPAPPPCCWYMVTRFRGGERLQLASPDVEEVEGQSLLAAPGRRAHAAIAKPPQPLGP